MYCHLLVTISYQIFNPTVKKFREHLSQVVKQEADKFLTNKYVTWRNSGSLTVRLVILDMAGCDVWCLKLLIRRAACLYLSILGDPGTILGNLRAQEAAL